MRLRPATELLAEIEHRVDVNAVRYGPLRVWPLVRRQLWLTLVHPAPLPATQPPAAKRVVSGASRVLSAARSALAALGQQRELDGLERTDLLIKSQAAYNQRTRQGLWINRHADPYADFAESRGLRCVELDLDGPLARSMVPRYRPTRLLHRELHLRLHRRVSRHRPRALTGLDAVARVVAELAGPGVLNRDSVLFTARTVDAHSAHFRRLVARLAPRAVFLNCYYAPEELGLVRACRVCPVSASQRAELAEIMRASGWLG